MEILPVSSLSLFSAIWLGISHFAICFNFPLANPEEIICGMEYTMIYRHVTFRLGLFSSTCAHS